MRKTRSLLTLLFATLTSLAHAAPTSTESISHYFGTWRVASFENASQENPSHAYVTEEMAQLQIGKQFSITSSKATLDQGLIGVPSKTCSSPHYDVVPADAFIGPAWPFLLPDEHIFKRPGELLFFEVSCRSDLLLGFEVTKDEKLSVFYDGYFFFFTKKE